MSIVKMAGIVKRFGAVLANDHVDLDLEAGEIHALLGENGAGKTTLMNVLSGLYMPDEGEITVNGQRCHIDSPRKALALGIGMVHQHFMLAAPLTVAENIVLGMKTSRSPLLGLRDAEERIRQLSTKYHLQVDPKAYIWQLSAGERQRVEILKLLYREANILILDEPTAVLTPGEAGEMYLVVREMARQGHAVVLISHKLEEVTAWANRITVLRDGRVVDTVKGNVTRPELARMMVGREVLFQYERATQNPGEVVLSLQHVTARGARGTHALREVSLDVRRGEIVGIAGVAGNGQSELADAIAGLLHVESGQIVLGGRDITNGAPDSITRHGLGYIPEDRQETGLLLEMSISENLILKEHNRPPFAQSRDAGRSGDPQERRAARADLQHPRPVGHRACGLPVGRQPAEGRAGARVRAGAAAYGGGAADPRPGRGRDRVDPQAAAGGPAAANGDPADLNRARGDPRAQRPHPGDVRRAGRVRGGRRASRPGGDRPGHGR